MRFKALASSSAGNAYVVEDGRTHILLECGLSHKRLQALTGFSLSDFDACLVSHEHKDHAGSVEKLVQDGMRVYMSEGTARALEADSVELVEDMGQFAVGSFDIVPFATFHDAAEPLGFLLKSRVDGDVLAFATDTVNLRYRFPGVNILAVEANYDKNILAKNTKMPEKVRHRIENAHMEIGTLCDYLAGLDLTACREIHLLHLSNASSREWEFIHRVKDVVPPGIDVTACGK